MRRWGSAFRYAEVLLLSPLVVCVMGGVGVYVASRFVVGQRSPATPQFRRGKCGCQAALGVKGVLLLLRSGG